MGTDGAIAPAQEPRAGWDELVALRADAMHFAGWLGVPPSSREDIVQTALVRVFPHAASLDKPSSLKAYLFATVKNLWRNECRRRPLAPDLIEADVVELTPGPDEIVDSRADCDIARSAFETLAPSHREVIHLRYIDGLAYTDVARALGVTRSTARQRLHRARECLRTSFIRSDPDRD